MCAAEAGVVIVADIVVDIVVDIAAAIVAIVVDMEAGAMPADIAAATMDRVTDTAVVAIVTIMGGTGMDGLGGSVLPPTLIMTATIMTTITLRQDE
jgi:hypothetical protein